MDPTDSPSCDFAAHGFTLQRGLYCGSSLRALQDAVDQVQSWPESPGRYMKYFDVSEVESSGRLLNRVENFVPYHAVLAHEIVQGRLFSATANVLGEEPRLFKDKINFKLPGGGGFEAHQDAQAGWNDYAPFFVTAAVAIDPTTIANGCLELGVWEHRHRLIGALWEPLTDQELSGIGFEPVPMEPGDAVFFDAYLPHRSAPNTTREPRRVLYVTYNRASDGDHRSRYYADKRKSYPPDCERSLPGNYRYRV